MSPTDTTRKATTALVAAVGLFAGGDSYTHIYDLARSHGQDALSAALLPLAGDGLVIASSWVMLAAAKQGKEIPIRARITFWAGVAATVAANGAFGYSHGVTAALLSLWPVAAYLGCMEMLTWMHQNLGAHPKRARTVPAAVPMTVPASAPASPEPSAPAVPDASTPDDLQVRRARRELAELIATAEAKFPEVKAGGKIPGIRAIKDALVVGQPYAQQIQAHFRQCQAGARSVVLAA